VRSRNTWTKDLFFYFALKNVNKFFLTGFPHIKRTPTLAWDILTGYFNMHYMNVPDIKMRVEKGNKKLASAAGHEGSPVIKK